MVYAVRQERSFPADGLSFLICTCNCCRWNRQWTAEENRHGDLMNKYCYLSGRVNMKAVERTIQNLIGSGMDPKTENNPYLGFIYTSFQERATKVRRHLCCSCNDRHNIIIEGNTLLFQLV